MKLRAQDRWLLERAGVKPSKRKKTELEKAHAKAQRNALEDRLEFDMRAFFHSDGKGVITRIPRPTREHVFAPPRKWRFDFAWPELKMAVEIHGGIFQRGRHSRGAGQIADFEKQNAAVLDGWRVLVFGPPQVMDGSAVLKVFGLLVVLSPNAASVVKATRNVRP